MNQSSITQIFTLVAPGEAGDAGDCSKILDIASTRYASFQVRLDKYFKLRTSKQQVMDELTVQLYHFHSIQKVGVFLSLACETHMEDYETWIYMSARVFTQSTKCLPAHIDEFSSQNLKTTLKKPRKLISLIAKWNNKQAWFTYKKGWWRRFTYTSFYLVPKFGVWNFTVEEVEGKVLALAVDLATKKLCVKKYDEADLCQEFKLIFFQGHVAIVSSITDQVLSLTNKGLELVNKNMAYVRLHLFLLNL